MFGDMGHGFVLFLVGSFLCLFEGPLRRRSPGMEGLLQLRYIFLLMGLFATYCGIIYNDFMAIPIWAFDSCYDVSEAPKADFSDQVVDDHAPNPNTGFHN
jgi:V-type H+-transporting ATPase subunit a